MTWEVSPNPSARDAKISIQQSHQRSLRIIAWNGLGQKVWEFAGQLPKVASMDVPSHDWPKGVYLLQILDDKGQYNAVKCFVKQ